MNNFRALTDYDWDRTESQDDALQLTEKSTHVPLAPAPHPVRIRRRVHLTKRDRDIIQAAIDDKRNKQTASELGLSECTVKVYLSRVFSKLGVDGHRELARWGRAYAEFERRAAERYHEHHPDEPKPPTFEDIRCAAYEVFRTAAQTVDLTAEQKSEVMDILFTRKSPG